MSPLVDKMILTGFLIAGLLVRGVYQTACKTDAECKREAYYKCVKDCGCDSIQDDIEERRKCDKACATRCQKEQEKK